jgi:hypothetical protein
MVARLLLLGFGNAVEPPMRVQTMVVCNEVESLMVERMQLGNGVEPPMVVQTMVVGNEVESPMVVRLLLLRCGREVELLLRCGMKTTWQGGDASDGGAYYRGAAAAASSWHPW